MDNKEANNWRLAFLPAALVVVCCAAPFLLGGLAAGAVILAAWAAPSLLALAALFAVGVGVALIRRQRGIARTIGTTTGGLTDCADEPREPGQVRSGSGGMSRSTATTGASAGAVGPSPLRVRILKTPGCVSCASVERAWAELRPEYDDRVQVEVVDLLKQPEVARRYGILRSPAVVSDEEVRSQGALDRSRLRALLDQALREHAEPRRGEEDGRA
jgi:hypothetical protein